MNVQYFSTSENFFDCKEPLIEAEIAAFNSWRGRKLAISRFFKRICIIPLAFLAKLFRTFSSIVGLGFAFSLLVLTLGCEAGLRRFFLRRVLGLVTELTDWIFWPIAIVFCLSRLLLAATVHPAIYFGV